MKDDNAILEGVLQGCRAHAAGDGYCNGVIESLEALRAVPRLWDALDTVPDAIFVHDGDYAILAANKAYAARAGLSQAELIGKPYFQVFPKMDGPLHQCVAAVTGRGREPVETELTLADGTVFEHRGYSGHDGEGRFRYGVHLLVDVTAQRREVQLRRRLSAMVDNAADLAALMDAQGRVVYLNGLGRRLVGMEPAAELDLVLQDLFPEWPGQLDEPGGRDVHWSGEAHLQRLDGGTVEVALTVLRHEDPEEPVYFSFVARDISELKRYQSELERKTHYDDLTGLPNRSLLHDRLQQALAAGERYEQEFALLFITIDQFKQVNDGFGHPAGDEALRAIAERIRRVAREVDTVARFGSDEFVMLLTNLRQADDSVGAAERLLALVAEPLPLGDESLRVTASIGISVFPRDGREAETLLGKARAAMQLSGGAGGNGVRFYEPEANARVVRRLTLEGELRRAVEKEQFVLHYQPRIDSASGGMAGMEALVRWQHPQRGLLAPGEFIHVAEQSGLILPLGDWVLHEACRQISAWQKAGLAPARVSVNLSAHQLREDDLEYRIRGYCDRWHVEARDLELELTESLLIDDPETTQPRLRRIKDQGVMLAIDDFGTGYSSLSYLHRFPFDLLKVDRSFVQDVTYNPQSATILRTILAMARNLGMRAVAEGVETAPQAAYLCRHGCEELQGFFFERPLPAAELEQRLREGRIYAVPKGPEAGTRTLLLVDDEPNVTRALQRVLRQENYRILSVNQPEEAFEVLASEQVQVVICDQRMPRLGGTELLSKVKDLHPETVRIVLSGYTDLAAVTEAVNKGQIYKFLSKPWDDDEIRREVRSAFQFFEQQHSRSGRN